MQCSVSWSLTSHWGAITNVPPTTCNNVISAAANAKQRRSAPPNDSRWIERKNSICLLTTCNFTKAVRAACMRLVHTWRYTPGLLLSFVKDLIHQKRETLPTHYYCLQSGTDFTFNLSQLAGGCNLRDYACQIARRQASFMWRLHGCAAPTGRVRRTVFPKIAPCKSRMFGEFDTTSLPDNQTDTLLTLVSHMSNLW
jgi:hypothetical protein